MALILIIDLLVVAILCATAISKGLESALPFATFAIVFLPIETRLSVGIFELTAQRLVFVVLFLLYLIAGGGKNEGEATRKLTAPLKYLIFLHVAWCVISTLNSIEPVSSIKKLASVVLEYYGLYFIFWKTISKPQTIHKILLAMLLAIAAASVFGAFEAYRGWNVVELLPRVEHRFAFGADVADAERDVRVQSTFDHPILFGAALAMAIPIALYFLTLARKHTHKLLLWAALALMFLNLYKTGSRGPWIDAILACVVLAFLGGAVRNRILAIGALSVFVMIVRPGIRETIYGVYINTFNTNTNTGASYEYRKALPRAALQAILRSPARAIWGYGLETFPEAHVEGIFLGEMYHFLSADNAWAELGVETGFVGVLLIGILLLTPLIAAFKQCLKFPPPGKHLSAVFFVSLLIFYIQMYSVGMYSWGQNGYMLWIMISLTMAFPKVRQFQGESNPTAKSPGGVFSVWRGERAGYASRPKPFRLPAGIAQRSIS